MLMVPSTNQSARGAQPRAGAEGGLTDGESMIFVFGNPNLAHLTAPAAITCSGSIFVYGRF